jgi:hypothetical protein
MGIDIKNYASKEGIFYWELVDALIRGESIKVTEAMQFIKDCKTKGLVYLSKNKNTVFAR